MEHDGNIPQVHRPPRKHNLTCAAVSLALLALLVTLFGSGRTASAAALSQPLPSSMHNGVTLGDASCAQPPQGVDLSTLSGAQLAYYGLLPRPTDPSRIGRWREILSHSKHRYCDVTPAPGVHATSQESFTNWAGNIAINSGYNDVSANWYVPCLTSSPKSAWSVTWVGMGGDPNDGGGNLVQAGTEQDTDSSGNLFFAAWYEDYPHDPVEKRLTNYPVWCGNYMYVEVYQSSSTETYYIDDYTSNSYASPSESGYTSNGSTAEWIEERPTVNGSYATLADFGSVTFSSAFTLHNGNSLSVGQTTHNYAVMCRDGLWTCGPGSTQLAHPGPISSDGTSFTVYYDAS